MSRIRIAATLAVLALSPLSLACSGDGDSSSSSSGASSGSSGTSDSSSSTGSSSSSSSSSSSGSSTDSGSDSGSTGGADSNSGSTGGDSGSGSTGGAAGNSGSGSSGGSGSSCPADFASATPLTAGTAVSGTLADPLTSVCHYKLEVADTGFFEVVTSAKPQANPFDTTYVDTVVTLYDANQQQLAQDDDPLLRSTNDSDLVTRLAPGTYYVTVEDCNAAFGASNCYPAAAITHRGFSLGAGPMTAGNGVTLEGAEPNDDAEHATPVPNAPATGAGKYYASQILGVFDTATDVDAYTVSVPADVSLTSGSRADLFVYPDASGAEHDGSTVSAGTITVIDPDDATHALARIDAATQPSATLGVPVTPGKDYLLLVQRPEGTVGANDFYALVGFGGSGNPLENDTAGANDTAATAQALTADDTGAAYYVEGDLSATDQDWFSLAVPAGTRLTVTCGGQVQGSGLRGLTANVFAADGTTSLGTATEDPATGVYAEGLALPDGTSTVLVQLTASAQADDVTGSYYLCGFYFQ